MENWNTRKEESLYRAEFKMYWDGEKVKKFRNMLGLSQNEFSEILGIHQANLSLYEKGRKIGNTDIIGKLTNTLENWKEKRIQHLQSEIDYIKSF